MKRFVMLMLLTGGMLLSSGCLGTPGLSPAERNRQIARNWNFEGGQAVDDFDRFMLLRPPSRLTIWNIR